MTIEVKPMSIHDCEYAAKTGGCFDSLKFIAIFPSGPRECQWLDAHMGIFKVEGLEGFLMTRQCAHTFPNLICIPQPETEEPA